MTKTAENTGAYLNELGPNKIHHFIGAANISTVKAFAGTLPLNLALRYPDVFGFIKTAQGR